MLHVLASSARTDLLIRTATSASAGAVSTPNSSECDEGVTIHADPTVVAVADESVQSSPSAKEAPKEVK
jgi:hypothetical protein